MSETETAPNDAAKNQPKTKRVFPHSASVGDITLDDEMGGEYNDLEGADSVAVLGYEVISTTGDFYVERDWLLAVMDDVGLPEWMAPVETAPHRAFGRARDELLEDGWSEDDTDDVVRVTYRLESDEGRSRVYNLLANVHIPSQYIDQEGGANNGYELGVITYDSDTQKPKFYDKIEANEDKEITKKLSSDWEQFQMRFADLWDKHREGHVGKDINTMFNQYFINQWTDSVQLRPAVYFVPATQELPVWWSDDDGPKSMRDLIGYDEGEYGDRKGFSGLYGYINDVKQKSLKTEDTEIIRLPVYDNADQREMVQRKVRKELDEAVRNAYSTIIDQMANDETVAADVADAVAQRFDDMSSTVGNYKAIIQTEMAVEEVMRDVLADMDDVDGDLVRSVVNELDTVDADV